MFSPISCTRFRLARWLQPFWQRSRCPDHPSWFPIGGLPTRHPGWPHPISSHFCARRSRSTAANPTPAPTISLRRECRNPSARRSITAFDSSHRSSRGSSFESDSTFHPMPLLSAPPQQSGLSKVQIFSSKRPRDAWTCPTSTGYSLGLCTTLGWRSLRAHRSMAAAYEWPALFPMPGCWRTPLTCL